MTRNHRRLVAAILVLLLAVPPTPSQALAPVLLLLVKQIVKDAAQSMLKDMVLSSLNGMGCKGMAIANALQSLDLRKGGGGGVGAMMGMPGGGMPGMPPGMVMPQMPAGMSMPGMPAGMNGIPGANVPGMTGNDAEIMARARELMPNAAQLPAGTGVDPEQMARIMQAMSQPLSPPETLAAIDEMAAIGFLPKAMQTELKECMVLLPAAAPALGMGMGMLKPMLPQLRQARDQLHALSPAEQDEIVAALSTELMAMPPADRKALLEFLDSGFFPKRVSDGLKARLKSG